MNLKKYSFTVGEESQGERLDKFLSSHLSGENVSRNKIKQSINERKTLVNGEIKVRANYPVEINDVIEIEIPQAKELRVDAEDINIDIVYEDDDIIVVNKPNDMVVHPGAGNPNGTLVNALVHKFKNIEKVGGSVRPGLVHRIDKLTTGLLVVAKNEKTLNILQEAIKHRKVKRTYLSLVHGYIGEPSGTIDAPIGRHPTDRIKMAVTMRNAKPAVTHFKVVRRWNNFTLLECNLETGRTHQIRVHLSYIRHPIVGDFVYGRRKTSGAYGQYLHAYKLKFVHPTTKKMMEFTAPLPDEFQDKIESIA